MPNSKHIIDKFPVGKYVQKLRLLRRGVIQEACKRLMKFRKCLMCGRWSKVLLTIVWIMSLDLEWEFLYDNDNIGFW